jgi:carbonic anhydrase/acetyltransferase-like protein (isoleucine patch superfamily)
MMPSKYKLKTDISVRFGGKTLYAIEALRGFADVSLGDIGGFIETEDNLSHEGDCWIYDSAQVHGKARVDRDAQIKDQAVVRDNAKVTDSAVVAGQAEVFQNAMMYDHAHVDGMSTVYGNAQIFGNAKIIGHSKVHDDAWVYGDIVIDAYANITAKVTKKPIVLSGFTPDSDITIMDEHISIGCQTKTFDGWRNVTREEAYAMNGKEGLKLFRHIPDTLEFLIQKYRKNHTNV